MGGLRLNRLENVHLFRKMENFKQIVSQKKKKNELKNKIHTREYMSSLGLLNVL